MQPRWHGVHVQESAKDARRIHAQIEAEFARKTNQLSRRMQSASKQEATARLAARLQDVEKLSLIYLREIDALKAINAELTQALQRERSKSGFKVAFASGVANRTSDDSQQPLVTNAVGSSSSLPAYSCSRTLEIHASSPEAAEEVVSKSTKAARREVSMRADKTPDGSAQSTSAAAAWVRSLGLDELIAQCLCEPLMPVLTRAGADELSADALRVGQLAYIRSLGNHGDEGTMAALLAPALCEIPKRLQAQSMHAGLLPQASAAGEEEQASRTKVAWEKGV